MPVGGVSKTRDVVHFFARPKRNVVCAPAITPSRAKLSQPLPRVRRHAALLPDLVGSRELDVKAVVSKVQLGEADAGIVYVTDVRSAATRVAGVAIPDQQQVVARYPIAVVKGAKDPQLAGQFIDYLTSPEGQKILAGFGFSRP